MTRRPKVTFTRQPDGKLKLIPCVCGSRRLVVATCTVKCKKCGEQVFIPFKSMRQKHLSPRYSWNCKMRNMMWEKNRKLFYATFGGNNE